MIRDPFDAEGLHDHAQTTSGDAGIKTFSTSEMTAFPFFRCSSFRSFRPFWQSQKVLVPAGKINVVSHLFGGKLLPQPAFWCISERFFLMPQRLGSLWCPSILSQFLTVSMKRQDWLTTKSARNLRSEAWQKSNIFNSRHGGLSILSQINR